MRVHRNLYICPHSALHSLGVTVQGQPLCGDAGAGGLRALRLNWATHCPHSPILSALHDFLVLVCCRTWKWLYSLTFVLAESVLLGMSLFMHRSPFIFSLKSHWNIPPVRGFPTLLCRKGSKENGGEVGLHEHINWFLEQGLQPKSRTYLAM